MSAAGGVPPAGPGGLAWYQGEPYDGDPRIAPGLARPIGWRVREPDGTAAYDKFGPLDTNWTPVGTPSTGTTLAAVYAAGAGARITDDLMTMLHGNLRFQAPVDSAPLPILGYFEDATGEATSSSGFPSELWSLAVVLGTDNGRVFDTFQMFNPTWDGLFGHINGMSWITETVSFTGSPTNAFLGSPKYGQRSWKTLANWAIAAYPQAASAAGTVRHETQLYNTIDNGLRFVHELDGFGQTNQELSPNQNGLTWQWASHWNHANVAGAANDGLGWGVYAGTLDQFTHLQAGLAAKQVTADPLGDWYWDVLVSDGAGGLASVAQFARAGITFDAPVTAEAGGLVVSKISVEVDLAALSAGTVIVPAVAGKTFIPLRVQVYTTQVAGAMSTAASIQLKAGAATLVAPTAGLTNATAFAFGAGGLIQSAPSQATMPANTASTVDVTVAATGTGGFIYKVKLILTGFYL